MGLTDDVSKYLDSEKDWVERISTVVRELRDDVAALTDNQSALEERLAALEAAERESEGNPL
jgi:hypothetical protein